MFNKLMAFSIFGLVLYISLQHFKTVDRDIKFATENERLRSFNTRMMRRLKWINMPEKIDPEAVALAEHIEGTPASMVAALIFCENGPEDIETGSIDKTDYWAKNLPIKYWSKLDGARTLNRMLWNWIQAHPDQFKLFLFDAARPYTNMSKPLQMTWASNMFASNERFKKDISTDRSEIKVVANFTPTPDYGFQDSQAGKAKAPAKKVHHVRRVKK